MKKYLVCVLFLCLIMASSRTACAAEKVCGGPSAGFVLDAVTGKLTLDADCTSIAPEAFLNKTGSTTIKSVDLSNTSITTIGYSAFYDRSSLASVKFPASLTSIGEKAFTFCTALASVDLSNTSITTVGDSAFYKCDSLASVKFPASLTSIGELAFCFSPSLASVDLSNTSITSIGDHAFHGMANPSTITVTKGSKAHELLGGLSSVTDDPIKSDYGNNYTKLIVIDPPTPTPTPDPLEPTPLPTATPQPGTASGAAEVIRVVPLPEDEFGSYELDPVTGEKNYLMFHTYDICMNFLNNDELCSGYEHCYHK